MTRQKAIDFLLELYTILIAIRNICLFLGISGIAAIVFYAVYIVVAVVIVTEVYCIVKTPVKANLYFASSFIVLAAMIAIPFKYGSSIWVDNGFMPISFLLTMFLIIISRRIVVSTHTIDICYRSAIVQALFAIALSFFPGSYQYGSLVLHMGNPNQTAIVLWTIFSFCFLYWTKKRHSHRRSVGLWLLMAGLLILVYLTESRAALLSAIIVIILYTWIKRTQKKKEIPVIPQIVLSASPIVIPVIVLTLFSVLPSNITFMGKMIFSGRENIWNRIVAEFMRHPFMPHLNESPYSTNILQNGAVAIKTMGAHNGILAIQWYYGLLVAILASYIISVRISDIKRCAANNLNSCVTHIVILATIFSLSFEEGMLMGNICTTMILPLLFIIGQSEELLES